MKQILIKSLLFHFAKRVIYMLLLITRFSKKFIWESQPLIYLLIYKPILILAHLDSAIMIILQESELRGSLFENDII